MNREKVIELAREHPRMTTAELTGKMLEREDEFLTSEDREQMIVDYVNRKTRTLLRSAEDAEGNPIFHSMPGPDSDRKEDRIWVQEALWTDAEAQLHVDEQVERASSIVRRAVAAAERHKERGGGEVYIPEAAKQLVMPLEI